MSGLPSLSKSATARGTPVTEIGATKVPSPFPNSTLAHEIRFSITIEIRLESGISRAYICGWLKEGTWAAAKLAKATARVMMNAMQSVTDGFRIASLKLPMQMSGRGVTMRAPPWTSDQATASDGDKKQYLQS
jgi:hypothetical protein